MWYTLAREEPTKEIHWCLLQMSARFLLRKKNSYDHF